MDSRLNRWRWIVLILGGCVCLGACQRRSSSNPPNIDSLRQALERSANLALPDPSLVNRNFALMVSAEQLPAKSAQIVGIVRELKGTVLPAPASAAGTNLLISLPGNRLVEFASRALGQSLPREADASSDLPVLVEVALTPEAGASVLPIPSPAQQ